ncbi:MAG: GtrA family protein [Patescibacteria group bacterium]|nr:GtrA family protein [Patescibacteria group bacterium]
MDYLKIIRYIISGGTAAAVNLGALYILTDRLGWWYLFSSIAAFGLAFIVSFTLQKFWTFKEKSFHTAPKQLTLYFLVITVNLLINTALMYFMVDIINLPYLLGQVIVGGLIAFGSFFVYRHLIFRPHPNEITPDLLHPST